MSAMIIKRERITPMGKIIVFGSFINKKQQYEFTKKLQEKVQQIEIELGIEDEPLTVLTDEATINLGNQLIDIKESVQSALQILNISESEEVPWEN